MSIRVLKPGPLSSLQDLGRHGYQRFGVIVSGVMDEWSHRVANILVGNPDSEASLEITLMGPSLSFEQDALISICGADLSPRISESPVPLASPVLVRAGSQLDFGKRVSGCRAYLAVHGGFRVAPVMGSKSTYLRAGFGGFEGRALRKGDLLQIGEQNPALFADGTGSLAAQHPLARLPAELSAGQAPFVTPPGFQAPQHPSTGNAESPIRFVAGQQWAAFTDQAQRSFCSEAFRVDSNSDRMGYRLQGPPLALTAPLEMISEGVAFGSVQVPPDGNPIVLMADRQTTGGYPKIAAIASVDLPLLAQAVPQQLLRFERIELTDAQQLHLQREHRLDDIRRSFDNLNGAR
jgi:antagonist of KipI